MTIVCFLLAIALSAVLALASRRGEGRQDARQFFVASGQFSALLVFFLSVGETYSVASMLGFPGGVFAHGDGFSAWFFGYILMVAPVLFFVGPWIARAGKLYGAATIADFFARHYESRVLELVITIAAVVALVPVGTMQFLGLKIVLTTLAPQAPPLLLIGLVGLLTFAYVVIAGLRTSAYVAILKDLLMLGSIVAVSAAALTQWQSGLVAAAPAAAPLTTHDALFATTTILVQAVGYAMLPQTWGFLFSARSAGAIRRSQVAAPLYMLMFPLLMCVATYALLHGLHPRAPDFVFLASAQALLPDWLVGFVLAAVTLAGLVLLTTVSLAISSLVTRNLLPGLGSSAQRHGAKLVTALYLLASIALAEETSKLMATMNNLTYFLIVQMVPALGAAFLFPRVSAQALIAGIFAGDAMSIVIFGSAIDIHGVNPGLVGLIINLVTIVVLSRLLPRSSGLTVLEKLRIMT